MPTGLADVDILALTARVAALEKKAGITPPGDPPIGTHVTLPDRPPSSVAAPETRDELRIGNETRAPAPVEEPTPRGLRSGVTSSETLRPKESR